MNIISPKKAVFLDRDGTINFDSGYINHPNNFVLFPFAAQAIRMLNSCGYLVIVVTNQSGIGKGVYTVEMMEKINNKMVNMLLRQGASIDGIFYCPHDTNSSIPEYAKKCLCRKPKAGMFYDAAQEFSIDPNGSYIIGDKHTDLEAGWTFGCKGILVKTGYGRGDLLYKSNNWSKSPDYIAENLLEAVKIIVDNR